MSNEIKKLSKPGFLSVFPIAKDSTFNLHHAVNNAESILRQTLAVNGKYIILKDASIFPDSGLIKINSATSKSLLETSEVIFYGRKIGDQLHLLQRGYNGTSPTTWPAESKVSCPLMAEYHNAIKDAIIRIQKKIGLTENPTPDSINGVIKYLENKWLSPKPIFKAFPREGTTPLTVTFHNFSTGLQGRYLWDFGDGTTSSEEHPIHEYHAEGQYTVRLTMISANGAQGLTEKPNYIEINNNRLPSFFYATPLQGSINTKFTFVDQSDGDVVERHWFFGDGMDLTISNPNIHSVTHNYTKAGKYLPSLIVRLTDNKTRRVFLPEEIDVV